MELLPADLREMVPALYGQENNPDPRVYLKFFTPDSNWTWFVTEGQPQGDDFIFFGHVCGFEDEWGYFTLSELASVGGGVRLPIERDIYFVGGPFSEVIARHRNEGGQS